MGLFTEDYEQDREPVKRKSWVEELLDALEAMSVENVREYQQEAGFYIGLKERVKSPVAEAHIDIILHITRYNIEENYDDVTKYRSWKKEYCRV